MLDCDECVWPLAWPMPRVIMWLCLDDVAVVIFCEHYRQECRLRSGDRDLPEGPAEAVQTNQHYKVDLLHKVSALPRVTTQPHQRATPLLNVTDK